DESAPRESLKSNQGERKSTTQRAAGDEKNIREKITPRVRPSKLTALRRNATLVRVDGDVVLERRQRAGRRLLAAEWFSGCPQNETTGLKDVERPDLQVGPAD